MEERIYIGGLDPPRMMVLEVASHLDSIAGVQIHSKYLVSDDKTFFFINAVMEEGSALEKIANQYNNVTWKQCKLVMQAAAQPHLLERLALEQLQGKNDQGSQLPIQEEVAANQKIPCHLQIHKKYGDKAYHVDMKPCRADVCPVFAMHWRKCAASKKPIMRNWCKWNSATMWLCKPKRLPF